MDGRYGWREEVLSPAKRDELIEALARRVVARRLETPAIFMLEAHKPFSFLASQALLLAAPLAGVLFGFREMNRFAGLLEDRENVTRIVERIERLAEQRDAASAPRAGRVADARN